MENNLGGLAQGIKGRVAGTDNICLILCSKVPKGRQLTYFKREVSKHPNKTETHRLQNCVGGYRLDYPGPTTQCAKMTRTKILINITISTEGENCACFDI